jgi:hypothetical protein
MDPNLPNLHDTTDPRRPGGDIVGPDSPYERNAALVDVRDSVLLEWVTVSVVKALRGDEEEEPAIALLLEGRINQTKERSRVLYVMNADAAAGIVTELVGIAKRDAHMGGTELAAAMRRRLGERWDEMPK